MDPVDREAIYQELWRVRVSFRRLVIEQRGGHLGPSGVVSADEQHLGNICHGVPPVQLASRAGSPVRVPRGRPG